MSTFGISDLHSGGSPTFVETRESVGRPLDLRINQTTVESRKTTLGGKASGELGSLFNNELWWRDRYLELESRGYRLRPRYHPDWKPSWKQSGIEFYRMEDGQPSLVSVVILMLSMLIVNSP